MVVTTALDFCDCSATLKLGRLEEWASCVTVDVASACFLELIGTSVGSYCTANGTDLLLVQAGAVVRIVLVVDGKLLKPSF